MKNSKLTSLIKQEIELLISKGILSNAVALIEDYLKVITIDVDVICYSCIIFVVQSKLTK